MVKVTGYRKEVKVKLFLGAYLNQSNAQNLNCKAIAQYIDRSRFVVTGLQIRSGNFGKIRIPGVRLFTCYFPVKLTRFIGYTWGIYNCDIAFLPRANIYKYQKFLCKVFQKKSFKTIERIIDPKESSVLFNSYEERIDNYFYTDKTFSITEFMRDYHLNRLGLKTNKKVLPLLVDTKFFHSPNKITKRITDVVFIGNDMKRKGIEDYLTMAKENEKTTFHVVGNDSLKIFEKPHSSSNVVYHGMLNHLEIKKLIQEVQLYILPSRSEGFPRTIIEVAAAKLPTITYSNYGARDWITSGVNGIVCDNFDEMKQKLLELLSNQEKAIDMQNKAYELSKTHAPDVVVKQYEYAILDLFYSNK